DLGARPQSDQGAAGSRTPAGRTPSDQSVSVEAPTTQPGTAGSEQPPGSGYFGEPGIPSDHTPTERVREAAEGDQVAQKRAAQDKANLIEVLPGNLRNIRDTLPFLRPAQHDDVEKAELRFARPEGYGILFTNSTGTGKTYSGMGIVRRFVSQGKDSIIIVAP